mmetsp:Transcript_15092/g.26909  ORF Transcript_15092/g.26909 Transcript_15092/m.26909 type:complete len:98 (+) Transcript_15092:1-294(+)
MQTQNDITVRTTNENNMKTPSHKTTHRSLQCSGKTIHNNTTLTPSFCTTLTPSNHVMRALLSPIPGGGNNAIDATETHAAETQNEQGGEELLTTMLL